MSRALITGHKGFVGSHFYRYLSSAGWRVHGVDIIGSPGADARELFLDNSYQYYDVVNRPNVDLVVHCAAIVGGRKTIDGAPLALASNLELDAGLFQWALRARPKRILYFSSSAVYPVREQNRHRRTGLREGMVRPQLDTTDVGIPDQLYGWAKLTGENLAWRAAQEGLNVSIVRPFSGYGEDQPESYPFPAFIDRALRKEDPFTIWGDGTQTRDFIHINDIVEACMEICGQDVPGPVNLGWGRPTTMTDLASLINMAANGRLPAFEYHNDEPRGVHYRVADTELMRKFYTPRITLEEGIRMALDYRSKLA